MIVAIITFFIAQTCIVVWAGIKIYFSNLDHEKRIANIEKEHGELNKEIRRFSDTLLLVQRNTELLLDGRIKPSNDE